MIRLTDIDGGSFLVSPSAIHAVIEIENGRQVFFLDYKITVSETMSQIESMINQRAASNVCSDANDPCNWWGGITRRDGDLT